MIFFSFSTGGGGRWYVGPLVSVVASLLFSGIGLDALLHAPSFLFNCIVAAIGMLGLSYVFTRVLAYCFVLSSAFGLGSILFVLSKRYGIPRVLRSLFLGTGGRLMNRPRPAPAPQRPPRATTAQVADALRGMRTELYASSSDLASMTVRELKERLKESSKEGSDTLPALEKRELIDAICASHGDSSSHSCAICAEDYETGQPLRVLGCNHRFHIECVDKWLLACDYSRPPACPFCNTEIKMKPVQE